MSTLAALLIARFDRVRHDLDRVLDLLNNDDLDWSPHEGMLTIRGQLREVADKEVETLEWLATGVWPDDYEGSFEPDATLSTIRGRLGRIRTETLSLLAGMDENALRRDVANPEGWWEALGLPVCPLDEILRNIAAHEWFHTGQIIAYLGARGEDPYPR